MIQDSASAESTLLRLILFSKSDGQFVHIGGQFHSTILSVELASSSVSYGPFLLPFINFLDVSHQPPWYILCLDLFF